VNKATKFWLVCCALLFECVVVLPLIGYPAEKLASINCAGSSLCEYARYAGDLGVFLLGMLVPVAVVIWTQRKDKDRE